MTQQTNINYLGIDPGKEGAFVLLSADQRLLALFDMPIRLKQPCPHQIGTLYSGIRQKYGNPFTVIEKPHFRPTDGKKGIASYHLGAGYLLMPCLWGDWPIQMVPPQIWTRDLHLGLSKDLSGKQKSLEAFHALFPSLAKSKAFIDNKKIYDGRIDALLIAEYARRLHSGITNRQ